MKRTVGCICTIFCVENENIIYDKKFLRLQQVKTKSVLYINNMKINVILCVKKNAISLFAQLLKWKAFQNGVYIKAGCIYKGDVASKYK